jgi:hypothetical protein
MATRRIPLHMRLMATVFKPLPKVSLPKVKNVVVRLH